MKKFSRFLVVGTATTMLWGSVLDVSAAGLKDIFDAKYYADSYADLKQAFGYDEDRLYNHFITYGLKERRNMSPILNVVTYREAYGDLNAAFGDNWDAYVDHFFTFGAGEMRDKGVLFNPVAYANAYSDIKAAYGGDLMAITRHYLNFGIAENRTNGTANGYADIAAARKAAQAARQVTSNDGWKKPFETPDTDIPGGKVPGDKVPGTDVPGGNVPGGTDIPGSDVENPDNYSVIWDYDGRTEYEYDERGNCISSTVYNLTGDKMWSNHFTFNSNDELVYSESRDSEGNRDGYNQYEYDGGKLQKRTCYYENGDISYCETYEWNGNKVKVSGYDEEGNLISYKECETDSRLNFIREEYYSDKGELFALYVYTYDENDNVLTKIGYTPDGTEVSNNSFTYYENGTKKTETTIMGDYKEIFEYNENGGRASFKNYSNGELEEDYTYDYYEEGSLARISYDRHYSDGDIQYGEKDYDRQGRMQKETAMEEYSDGRLSMRVRECAADGSYIISSKAYDSDGKLVSKWSETYDAQDEPVKEIFYTFSDGNAETVTVKEYENGRIVRDSVYEADEVTLISATVYIYVETEYGYEEIIKELDANGNVVKIEGYMCDENGDHLGWKAPTSDGGSVAYWFEGKYKNQSWFYTDKGKLRRKEIKDDYNVMIAVYEYDEDGNEIALVYADGKWVRPSEGSGTGESGSDVSVQNVSNSVSGNDASGN